MSRSYEEALTRIPTQREKILNALKEAGADGITNAALNEICFRWHSRLSELQKEGYLITNENLGKGLWKYVLRKTPGKVVVYSTAKEELFETIDKHYNGVISTKNLDQLITFLDVNVHRNPGYFKARNSLN